MMKNYIVITGASKGLGEGIAKALINPLNHIICVSRGESPTLKRLANENDCHLEFKSYDLSMPEMLDSFSEELFCEKILRDYGGVYLVNNAGTVEPVGPAGDNKSLETIKQLNLNLIAPMVLTANLIRLIGNLPIAKRVVNISSGAALNPYEGWSSYCTSKAGLDMFTRCVAKEQEAQKYPVEIMSIAPGVVDTEMQEVIRNTSSQKFIHRQRFVQLKENGVLVSPELAGKHIAGLLLSNQFVNGAVIDIRDSYSNN